MTSFLPKNHNCVSPYLHASDVGGLIEFLKATLHAEEVICMAGPDGRVAHAEVRIGDSIVMMGLPPPGTGMPAQVHCFVEDVDAAFARALQAGATAVREPTDTFYGHRAAGVKDAFGNHWFFATQKEELSPEEMERRMSGVKP